MLPKPDACKGCPLYGNGQGFVPDVVREGAEVFVMGQNPGQQEEAEGQPFVGKTGQVMEGVYLPLAGLTREDVSIGNSIRCRWHNSNELPPLKDAKVALDHCRRAHLKIPSGTRLIVTQGEYALWSLTGATAVTAWRGWLLPLREEVGGGVLDALSGGGHGGIYHPSHTGKPVLATLHLAALFRQPEMVLPTRLDWGKARRYLDGEWPRPLPPIQTEPPKLWPVMSAFDTEFHYGERLTGYGRPGRGAVYRWSMATPDRQVYVVETGNWPKKLVVPQPATVVMHNAVADYAFARRLLTPWSQVRVDDSMLAHSVLWPGLAREKDNDSRPGQGFGQGLDFLGSLYSSLNRWKHLSQGDPITYAGADALGTLEVWQNLMRQFAADPQSWWVYDNCVRPLVPIILEAEEVGLRVNQQRAQQVEQELGQQVREAELRAQAACGWPISLASTAQVSQQLYGVEGLRAKRGGRK